MSGLLPLALVLAASVLPSAPARAVAMATAHLSAPDTTVPARRGDRLVVENFSGRVLVEVGEEAEVRLFGPAGRRVDQRLVRRGSRLSVEASRRHEGRRDMDAVLRVPRWMDVMVRGRDLDVDIRELEGRVEVRNVEGDISLVGTRGSVRASTVDGTVTARDTRGDLELRSQGDDVRVTDAVAERVEAQSGDGDVILRGVDASRVRAETLDGDAVLDGAIRPRGTYRVSVHDGDARISIPREAGVQVKVSTFDGEFVSDFPVTVERFRAGGTFDFTLGDGSARLEIQVFDGEIRLGERR